MELVTRRKFLARAYRTLGSATVLEAGSTLFSSSLYAQDERLEATPQEIDSWMEDIIKSRSFQGAVNFYRFIEPIYVVGQPIKWSPSSNIDPSIKSVIVPKGFVTDLASIPRPFFSVLPRDGNYAEAAVVHDYLYWVQTGSKLAADNTLKMAMQDLDVGPATVKTIYEGVSKFGKMAWDKNAAAKKDGEKKLLKFDMMVKNLNERPWHWSEYKKLPGVFEA